MKKTKRLTKKEFKENYEEEFVQEMAQEVVDYIWNKLEKESIYPGDEGSEMITNYVHALSDADKLILVQKIIKEM